jgi:dTDP-4-dehydrorhamnose 3,5-epimerase
MRFVETSLGGVWIVEADRLEDERGFFARTFDAGVFGARELAANLLQCSISYNRRRGTLRGMHWQDGEEKLIRCTRGAVFDVAIDLRPGATFKRWFSVELSADNHRQLYLPRGVAHGFLTLADDSEVSYQMSVEYRPELQHAVRWNDPAFAVDWPFSPSVISERDRSHPDFQTAKP